MARMRRAESRARYFIRQQAKKRGWDTNHVSRGGDVLEENEIVAYFPAIGLGLDRPDFLFCIAGAPVMVVEAKNDAALAQDAIDEAIAYADTINTAGRYRVPLAVGVAGQDDTGYVVTVMFLAGRAWRPLTSYNAQLTNLPAKSEAERALVANDATTHVAVPSASEFIDAAIELSVILRDAKVEAPLRPTVIGAMTLAMSRGDIDVAPDQALASVNDSVAAAIQGAADLAPVRKAALADALTLTGADFNRLAPSIGRVRNLLRRLNVRAVMQTDADFLGMFYEAFLRYGYDNNALGIVFTPRHITRFCVDLVGVAPNDRVVDLACGTGGFLVAAFDRMMSQTNNARTVALIKRSLFGCDTNPTVWALAMLNMFFRGDGKSNIVPQSCLDPAVRQANQEQFTRAFLNPPFSQENEPERDFVDASLDALEPGGILVVVVYAGIFADDDHRAWRRELSRRHKPVAMISLPEDLFYPTSAPTSILVARAHEPLQAGDQVLMARVFNDGFEKLKNRRVERPGSQLPEVKAAYDHLIAGAPLGTPLATTVSGAQLQDGEELSPQAWLPQPPIGADEQNRLQTDTLSSIIRSVAAFDGLSDVVIDQFPSAWAGLPDVPLNLSRQVQEFFVVANGKSAGEKHYVDGPLPYISSGDTSNSIIRLVDAQPDQVFEGGITVTAFGQAYVQPWPFIARGNGGSSVRVLVPRFNMSFRELLWFAAQINAQRWRFFYARMSIKSRLERLVIASPPQRLPDNGLSIAGRLREFQVNFTNAARI